MISRFMWESISLNFALNYSISQVKRVIPSNKLQENFKFSVKVNNSHVYFQTKLDKDGEVLREGFNNNID